MDDNTLQLINNLATKLGTTVEHLWEALIRQAPIEGMVNLITTVSWIVAAAWWFRFVRRKTTPVTTDEDRDPRTSWEDDEAVLAWFSVVLFGSVITVIVVYNLPMTIAAFLNPGYWALKQLIK